MGNIILPRATNSEPIVSTSNQNDTIDKSTDTSIPAVPVNDTPTNTPDVPVTPTTDTLTDNEPVGDLIEGEIVEIDGVDYTIDKEGNAVSADGSKKTKSELTSLTSVVPDSSISSDFTWDDIRAELGVQPTDENGTPIEYTNDREGLKKYTLDSFKQYRVAIENDILTNFFEDNKDIHQAYIHKIRTGSIEDFNAQPDWNDFDITNANEQELEQIYRAYRKSIGDDNDTIEDLVSVAKTNKNLAIKAAAGKEYFVRRQEQEKAEADKIEQTTRRKEEDDAKAYWTNVKNTIDAGKVKIDDVELTIPEVIKVTKGGTVKQYSKSDFYKYLTVPKTFEVNKQKVNATQYQYDKFLEDNARTHNHDVLDAFKTFVGGDLKQLIQRAVDTNKVNEVKRRLTSKAQNSHSGGGGTLILPIKNS